MGVKQFVTLFHPCPYTVSFDVGKMIDKYAYFLDVIARMSLWLKI
jgi:hypothetical protein